MPPGPVVSLLSEGLPHHLVKLCSSFSAFCQLFYHLVLGTASLVWPATKRKYLCISHVTNTSKIDYIYFIEIIFFNSMACINIDHIHSIIAEFMIIPEFLEILTYANIHLFILF